MNFFNQLDIWAQGYFWGTVFFPVEWYFAKPALTRVYRDVVGYVNPVLAKVTSFQFAEV